MKTVCPQCHMDGPHKMSCTDESNQARKDRVTVPATVREPIVESQMEHVHPQMLKQLKERAARCTELEKAAADAVSELRKMALRRPIAHEKAWREAADLIAQKLGLTPAR